MPNNKVKFRYGICQNSHMEETGKPCPLCQSKEIQRVIATKELVCSECKAKLKEIPRPATFWEKYGKMIIAAIAVLVIGGCTALFFLPGDKKDSEPIIVTLNHVQKTLKVGEQDTLVTTITPEAPNASIIWQAGDGNIVKVNNGVVEAVAEGKDSVIVQVLLNGEKASVACNYIVEKSEIEEPQPQLEESQPQSEKPITTTAPPVTKPTPTLPTSTLKLSYGTYTGQIKGGYPNGQGRLVYSTSRQINRNDPKGRTANPGDAVQGTFVNGFFTIGKHFDSSGNLIENINVGVVDGQYESK